MTWLLLLHQIPPSPPYLRAKVMRRLNQLGALAVKKSAYLLPAGDEGFEDFEWLRREIEQGGGAAWIFRCEPAGGISDESVREGFRETRAADFEALAEAARDLLAGSEGPAPRGAVEKLKRRREQLSRIDFFGAAEGSAGKQVEVLMNKLEKVTASAGGVEGAAGPEYRGRTWVTRAGAKVDRIASAWLIRRFIDPAARFRFADPSAYRHSGDELRFDMFEGEFTHEGELCTFEVLLRRFSLADPALHAVAEVVHDIDLKDAKFERPETAGIDALIQGIVAGTADDARRLEEGATVFDALYAAMARR